MRSFPDEPPLLFCCGVEVAKRTALSCSNERRYPGSRVSRGCKGASRAIVLLTGGIGAILGALLLRVEDTVLEIGLETAGVGVGAR